MAGAGALGLTTALRLAEAGCEVAVFDPAAPRVFDVAGGMGKLNEALSALGRQVTTFDRRHKHLPVTFAEREFTLDEPCAAELVVGMHPDGATRLIIEYAARHHIGQPHMSRDPGVDDCDPLSGAAAELPDRR